VGDVRDDVGLLFPAWSDSSRSGFAVRLPLAQLPRGRYPLSIRLESPDGGIRLLSGPEVRNDEPLVKVLASADRMVRPQDFELSAWVLTETGVDSVRIETDTGIDLGSMRLTEKHISLSAFERIKVSHGANRLIGKVFRGQVRTKGLPPSLYRLQVVVIDRENRRTVFPGPLVRSGSSGNEACAGQLRYLYYPGNHRAFRQDFPVAQSWAQLVSGQCVQVGIRGRVEYLRTTFGHKQDYRFDPNFPDSHQMKDGREMIGVALRTLLNMANRTGLPLLITLDGGVWADSAFSYPEFDVVDMLERREDTVQWNQHGHSEPDDALNNLAASFENPHLARMMSLNRFNEDFRRYKKRNLQAAVQEVVRFMKANPTIDVAINLDPDEYVNPWFQDTQWYDYNPDTLRQFREWLFHRGPYADGGELARARHEPRLTLTEAGKLAGRRFREIDDVDPPRNAIDYSDKWQHLWAWFRRHLVAQHYDDLARWAAEAGMPTGKIFTAQTFIQADVAVSLDDSARGWTDQAGVSIAGAKPRQGHLGAILYGPASRNFGKPRKGLSLIGNIRGIDPHWGVIEFHPATIEKPQTMPGHDDAYQTMFSIINGGARFMSPMWGSRADDQWLYPERFRSYDSMDGTPFEFQLAWWMLKLQRLPAGSLIYPFGNSSVSSNDGWTVDASTHMNVLPGQLQLSGSRLHLQSPILEGQIASSGVRLELDGSWTGRQVQAGIRLSGGRRGSCMLDSTTRSCSLSLNPLASIEQITFDWMPVVSGMPDIPVTVDEIRVFPQ
jgi:hypothetical protein